MRKDESGMSEWCQHSRNSALGKRGVNKRVRKNVKALLQTEPTQESVYVEDDSVMRSDANAENTSYQKPPKQTIKGRGNFGIETKKYREKWAVKEWFESETKRNRVLAELQRQERIKKLSWANIAHDKLQRYESEFRKIDRVTDGS